MEQFYLKNIELFHFRKFEDITYEFNPRMNVVIGKNESGKSTLLNFIVNSFYGISKNKKGKDKSGSQNKSPVRCYLNSQSGFGNRNNPADKPQHSRQL